MWAAMKFNKCFVCIWNVILKVTQHTIKKKVCIFYACTCARARARACACVYMNAFAYVCVWYILLSSCALAHTLTHTHKLTNNNWKKLMSRAVKTKNNKWNRLLQFHDFSLLSLCVVCYYIYFELYQLDWLFGDAVVIVTMLTKKKHLVSNVRISFVLHTEKFCAIGHKIFW